MNCSNMDDSEHNIGAYGNQCMFSDDEQTKEILFNSNEDAAINTGLGAASDLGAASTNHENTTSSRHEDAAFNYSESVEKEESVTNKMLVVEENNAEKTVDRDDNQLTAFPNGLHGLQCLPMRPAYFTTGQKGQFTIKGLYLLSNCMVTVLMCNTY